MRLIVRILTILCLAVIVYTNVWQRVQVLRFGYRVSEHEKKKEELCKEHRALLLKLSKLASVEKVENLSEMEFAEEMRVIELVNSE
jgi:hypothetical protein